MFEIMETQKKWCVKDTHGDVHDVVFFRVANGCDFEPVVLKNGAFAICPKDWKIIDLDALSAKARTLFAKHFPDFVDNGKVDFKMQ